jgi:SAM-dependent methyltransferase
VGIGCVHFLPGAANRRVVGLDPLERLPLSDLSPPSPLLASVKAARAMYEHHIEAAEATTLESSTFALVVVHNVLDHVRDPKKVLKEARRVLRTHGLLFLACDSHSLLHQLRHKLVTRRQANESWLVRAHPFQFRSSQLLTLVEQSGFDVLAHSQQHRWLAETVGRTDRLLLLAALG